MLKRKFAGVVIAGLLLGAGAANAAESVFPSSANETKVGLPDINIKTYSVPSGTVATTTGIPSNVSEVPAFPFSAQARTTTTDRLERAYGSAFPSAAREFSQL